MLDSERKTKLGLCWAFGKKMYTMGYWTHAQGTTSVLGHTRTTLLLLVVMVMTLVPGVIAQPVQPFKREYFVKHSFIVCVTVKLYY